MSKKRLTSWERRRRRRIRITVLTSVFIVLTIAAVLLFKLSLPYETWNLSQFYNISYGGYNTEGTVELSLNEEELDKAIDKLKVDYQYSLIHLKACNNEDYEAFKSSIQASVSAPKHLSNGSTVVISYSYDKELADKINLDVIGNDTTETVSGLISATKLSKEDIFKDLSVTFSGISPNVTMTITNNSPIPFLQNMVFNPVEIKDCYSLGEEIAIRAYYSKEEALNQHYSIDIDSEGCIEYYTVTSDSAYLSDASKLAQSVVDEAIASGYEAFTNANEYGVRIFCEANLVPVYINKQATFEWAKESFRSAYLKCVRDEYAGLNGNHYNDLDIIYEATLTQANGVNCHCYAVVRFSDLIVNSDGSVTYDFSNPKIMSADYKIDSIHKTVATNYEGTHTVTKIRGN